MPPIKWIAIGVIAVSACAALFAIFSAFEERGASKEREAIVHQNKEAGNAGENARLNLFECTSRGLRFDYAAGKCEP